MHNKLILVKKQFKEIISFLIFLVLKNSIVYLEIRVNEKENVMD